MQMICDQINCDSTEKCAHSNAHDWADNCESECGEAKCREIRTSLNKMPATIMKCTGDKICTSHRLCTHRNPHYKKQSCKGNCWQTTSNKITRCLPCESEEIIQKQEPDNPNLERDLDF